MQDEIRDIEINPEELIGKLTTLQTELDGDIARVIEVLLLENYFLKIGQSNGFRRGVELDFSKFPRFLQLTETE